ncbi:hypothetical protein [Mucilaginibacter lacusdianchii]|uniref:hypothetical protein n=1 Tax=Mucilaginibacter lacusdianchii TaxID=2684211 RepID=UPI00131BC793|nr:hypothetical protein [Mucilaginibacter sp. JXJ CY 39]
MIGLNNILKPAVILILLILYCYFIDTITKSLYESQAETNFTTTFSNSTFFWQKVTSLYLLQVLISLIAKLLNYSNSTFASFGILNFKLGLFNSLLSRGKHKGLHRSTTLLFPFHAFW